MSFSKQVWEQNAELYQATRDLPFNRELANGSLSKERFRHYMIQDAHYLEGFARALSFCSAKGWSSNHIAQFANAAQTAIVVERALHNEYFKVFDVTPEEYASTKRTPTCDHYVSFLISVAATEPLEVALSAILPCFWIYREVGKSIHSTAYNDNPYQAWIDTYSGEDFDTSVDEIIVAFDEVAALSSARTKSNMKVAFHRSAQFEWMFWDAAYRLEEWPV